MSWTLDSSPVQNTRLILQEALAMTARALVYLSDLVQLQLICIVFVNNLS